MYCPYRRLLNLPEGNPNRISRVPTEPFVVRTNNSGSTPANNLYWVQMSRSSRFLALACCLISAGVNADQVPATGKLLVATDEVRGLHFAETVILLLHYDESGTLGLVVNRPIAAAPIEALPQLEDLLIYTGSK